MDDRHLDEAVLGLPQPLGVSGGDTEAEVAQLRATVEQLQTALDNRPRIEHAVGMLMVLMSCSQDVAVFTLKRVSQYTNRKVIDVADLMTGSVSTRTPLPQDLGDALALTPASLRRTAAAGGRVAGPF